MVPLDQTMPSSSSRPIIVTHRAIVRDPMVAESTKGNTSTKTTDAASAESEHPAKDVVTKAESINEDSVGHMSAQSTDNEVGVEGLPEDQSTTGDTPGEETQAEANDGDADQMPATSPKKANTDEQAKRIAEAEALIASKKYFVPINAVRRRRSRQLLVVLLLLALVGGGATYYYMMYMVE